MNYESSYPSHSLASYITGLQAGGRLVFSNDEAQAALGVNRGAFLDAAEKLQKRHRLLNLRQGFYVIVPPQHLNLGSPPPASFIDDLMRHVGRPYYVGLLKAAELHGAAHHAVMEFQVVADKQMRPMKVGRSKIAFYFRKDIAVVAAGIEDRKTDSGKMKLSSVELTLLDLLRYPQANGGIDNVLTIFADLGSKLDADKLVLLRGAFERAIGQRAGYLLERAGFHDQAERLHRSFEHGPRLQWAELDPALAAVPDLAPEILTRDKRWRLIIRRAPEREE